MEIIKSNRAETALATTGSQAPWALAIREEFGQLPDFALRFAPKAQKYCAQNMVKAVENNLPNFARIIATYGEPGIAGLINTHITDAVIKMGEEGDVDPYDVQFIAEAITGSERFRTLRFTTVLGFFHLLKCGEFDIYGKVTPRKILEAFRKYAVEAQAKENRIAYEMEQRQAEAERREWAKTRVSWQEWATGQGITDPDPQTYFQRMMAEENARRQIWKVIADLIQTITTVISLCLDYREHPERYGGRHGVNGARLV